MSSSKSRKSSAPVLPFAKAFQRSVSPPARFANSKSTRSTSPTRVNLHGVGVFGSSSSPSVRFSINRSLSPSRSIAASSRDHHVVQKQKRTCMCSPTTHPGSFRCSLHKNSPQPVSYLPNRLNARRSAMANSLVRIGTVEGDLVRRALAQLIRPSSHQQRRRGDFQPRPSRLSVMSKATENDNRID